MRCNYQENLPKNPMVNSVQNMTKMPFLVFEWTYGSYHCMHSSTTQAVWGEFLNYLANLLDVHYAIERPPTTWPASVGRTYKARKHNRINGYSTYPNLWSRHKKMYYWPTYRIILIKLPIVWPFISKPNQICDYVWFVIR